MSNQSAPSRAPAVYRSRDSISKFRLRVRLQRVTSSSLFLEMARQEGDDVELKQMRQLETHSVPETRIFTWQEKVFSRAEVDKYSQPGVGETPLVEKYRRLVREMRDEGKLETIAASSTCLFSYVENDDALHVGESNEDFMTTSPSEVNDALLRRRRENLFAGSAGVRGVSGKTKREARIWRTMKIVADLSSGDASSVNATDTTDDQRNEVVICTIHYNTNGTLIVEPDFNPSKSSRPYLIDTDIGLDSWEFHIENVSESMTREEASKEAKILQRLNERQVKNRAALVGVDFDVPPSQSLRVSCRGEIVSAWDFEYDHLYVVWCVIPGKWWWGSVIDEWGEAKADSLLTGLTHCCALGEAGIAMFGECFELDLLYRNLGAKAENDGLRPNPLKSAELPFEIQEWPQLLVQVMSRDSWHRTRTEGYGVAPMPTRPGTHTLDVSCWRPVGGPVDELRRYFIGGSPELNDPFFVAKPPVDESRPVGHLNLFGFRTLTTGVVRVRLNLVFQSQAFVNPSKNGRLKTGAPAPVKAGGVGSRLRVERTGGMFHLVSIVQAFQQAKERMVEARESLLRDLKTE